MSGIHVEPPQRGSPLNNNTKSVSQNSTHVHMDPITERIIERTKERAQELAAEQTLTLPPMGMPSPAISITPPAAILAKEKPDKNLPSTPLAQQGDMVEEAARVCLPINATQKSEAVRAFERLIERGSQSAESASKHCSPVVKQTHRMGGTPSYSVMTGPVRRFSGRKQIPSTVAVKQLDESGIVSSENQDVKLLRNRWELSSKTGSPLHPNTNCDELMVAATQMANSVATSGDRTKRETPRKDGFAVETIAKYSRVHFEEPPNDAIPFIDDDSPDDTVTPCAPRNGDEHGSDSITIDHEDAVCNADAIIDEVSFYRRQQRVQRASRTAASTSADGPGGDTLKLPTIVFDPAAASSSHQQAVADRSDAGHRRRDKHHYEQSIQLMNKAITVQQEQIAQASRALRYCQEKPEFSGSREEMDAQRALLLANERRRALYTEFDRIKTILQSNDYSRFSCDGPCGTLTISHITIALARDFINEHINKTEGDLLYYFVVLLKHKAEVLSTQMVTSDDALRHGSLEIPHYLQLTELQHDFVVNLEVYSLKTRRELFTHAEKFQLPGTKSIRLKKKYKSTGGLFSPAGFTSPGITTAVLDPGFQRVGQLNLNLKALNRGKFMLEHCKHPLDGSIFVKLRCFADSAGAVEHRGFLSMYQSVSGLGSWTRYWCLLKHGQISFWKYPDDEPIKDAVATVDMSRSMSQSVELTDSEDCGARPHTFCLDVLRDVAHQEKHHPLDVIRILLSADSRSDCAVWCRMMNHTLRDLHLWNPDRKASSTGTNQ